ncbi:OLC1v1018711C1 [Oldenlandia corymbosa var. corymbosa]|uniref:non-specific serine/threonine protein kinase n=1 Tax=Oldenlandia corymbosa var. corymbosa TaxID=529605 RepID=A0AAV1ECB9_OLDCO|nr:OLC1v1018711C1 [Oldenlandia corymbosa var. corymbosa]
MGACFSVEAFFQKAGFKASHQFTELSDKECSAPPIAPANVPQISSPERMNTVVVASKDVKDLRRNPISGLDIFSYKEMKLAIKHFPQDQVLGDGGFGTVYKGVVDGNVRPGYKTMSVAIKELDPQSQQGDREWLAEVNYLGQLRHPNLLRLIGYCCEDHHRLLVYEYMQSGSVEKHLFRRRSLTWSRRMKIALDAAKGLAFLHNAERQIIYRDFKTSNILLDADFNAKLSDFGLAKDGPTGDQTHVSTRIVGTHGYAAPEYLATGHLTAKSDVFGFGVVLLELLTGRRATERYGCSGEYNLVDWVRRLLIQPKLLLRIIDPKMDGQYSVETATKVAGLASLCLCEKAKNRPNMSYVVQLLEDVNNNRFDEVPEQTEGTANNEQRSCRRRYELMGQN